eukprot:IDg5943t1
MGGDIALPSSEPWPQCDEHNSLYCSVLQIKKNSDARTAVPGRCRFIPTAV